MSSAKQSTSNKIDYSSRIVSGSEPFDPTNYKITAPKPNKNGGKVSNILFNKSPLCVALPPFFTWGPQQRVDMNKQKTGNYSMNIQFPNAEFATTETEAFLKYLFDLESYVMEVVKTNSAEWLGGKYDNIDIIRALYNEMIRYPRKSGSQMPDTSKPPSLSLKLPCYDKKWQPEIFDENTNPLYLKSMTKEMEELNSGIVLKDDDDECQLAPLKFIQPRSHVILLIQSAGIWFVNKKFSITWNVKQVVVKNPLPPMEGTLFLKIDTKTKELLGIKGSSAKEEEEENDEEEDATLIDDDDNETDVVVEPVTVSVVEDQQQQQTTSAVEQDSKKGKSVKKTTSSAPKKTK